MKYQTDPDYLQQEAYKDAYDLDVRTHLMECYRAHSPGWYEWLIDRLDLPENGRILELGCGPADLWQQNEGHPLPGCHFYLSDLSDGMVREARQRLSNQTATFSFAVLDAAALPFSDRSVDVVLGFGLLDHLPHRLEALRQIQRVLRPGGHFCTSTGGQTHLQEMESLIRPFLPEADYGGDPDQFGLENGGRLLASFFTAVQQMPYENDLLFRESAPLVAYILSEPEIRQQLSSAQRTALIKQIEQVLARRGQIKVTVKKGIFIGQRA